MNPNRLGNKNTLRKALLTAGLISVLISACAPIIKAGSSSSEVAATPIVRFDPTATPEPLPTTIPTPYTYETCQTVNSTGQYWEENEAFLEANPRGAFLVKQMDGTLLGIVSGETFDYGWLRGEYPKIDKQEDSQQPFQVCTEHRSDDDSVLVYAGP